MTSDQERRIKQTAQSLGYSLWPAASLALVQQASTDSRLIEVFRKAAATLGKIERPFVMESRNGGVLGMTTTKADIDRLTQRLDVALDGLWWNAPVMALILESLAEGIGLRARDLIIDDASPGALSAVMYCGACIGILQTAKLAVEILGALD